MLRLDALQRGAEALDAFGELDDALDVEDGTLQLNSTLGPPTFDPETGVRPVDAGVFCFFSENGTASKRRLDVQRYDRTLGEFRDGREEPCFAGLFP